MGFGDGDFDGGGSDRLIDAIVAWGDADAILRRIQAQLGKPARIMYAFNRSGATVICKKPTEERIFELLAPESA